MLTRNDVALVLGLAGFLLGGLAFFHGFKSTSRLDIVDSTLRVDGDTIEQLVNEKTQLQGDLKEANKRLSAIRTEVAGLMHVLADLEERVDAMDKKGRVLDPKRFGAEAERRDLEEQKDPAPPTGPTPPK